MEWSNGTRVCGFHEGEAWTGVVVGEDGSPDGEVVYGAIIKLDKPLGTAKMLRVDADTIVELLDDTDCETPPPPPEPARPEPILADLMEQYRQAQDVVAQCKRATSEAQEKAKSIRWKLLELMDANRLQNVRVTLNDGSSPLAYRHISEKPRATDKDAVMVWAESAGLDPMMFMQFSQSKFGAWWKERNEEGLALPPGVEVYREEDVRFRK